MALDKFHKMLDQAHEEIKQSGICVTSSLDGIDSVVECDDEAEAAMYRSLLLDKRVIELIGQNAGK